MSAIVGWLSAHPDWIAVAAYALLAVIARYAPNAEPWISIRSWITDYAQRNAKALPADTSARVNAAAKAIEITVGGKVVHAVPLPSEAQRAAETLRAITSNGGAA